VSKKPGAVQLGLEPDVTGRVGEHIGGNPRYAIYETNVWVSRYTENKGVTFDNQLSEFKVVAELLATP